MATGVFNLSAFLSSPSWEELHVCRKHDLFAIAAHFELNVSRQLVKEDLKTAVSNKLVEEGLLPVSKSPRLPVPLDRTPNEGVKPAVLKEEGQNPAAVEQQTVENLGTNGSPSFATPSSPRSRQEVLLKVRLAKLQLEAQDKAQARQAELELRRLELEAETEKVLKLKRLELELQTEREVRLRQLELQAQTSRSTTTQPSSANSSAVGETTSSPVNTGGFNVSKNIVLVPPFRESEVDTYFNVFERVAASLHWPREVWPLLLQCKLVGKAQEVCSALSLEESLNYDVVKSAILAAYELVPEAYRQRFRNHKRTANQTFVEFAREKATLFDRWITASKVLDYNCLRELILLEEFKNGLPERMVVHLNEQKVSTLKEAAVIADEFVLTHKTVFVQKHEVTTREPPPRKDPSSPRRTFASRTERECFYCHKLGHVVVECPALKRKNQSPKGVGLIKTIHAKRGDQSEGVDPCFKPFLLDGTVSLTGKPEDEKPIRILRDTGGSRSVILSDVLPLSDHSSCHGSILIQGVEMGYVEAPLHYVYIKSKLVNGIFSVAVRPSLPIKGVQFILGNDIAGGKVQSVPEVTHDPTSNLKSNDLATCFPSVFPACVLTRAQTRRKAAEIDLADSSLAQALATDDLQTLIDLQSGSKDTTEKWKDVHLSQLDLPVTRESLIAAQNSDPSLTKCFTSLSETGNKKASYFLEDGVLMRKWTAHPSLTADVEGSCSDDGDWSTTYQIVVPLEYRHYVVSLAHEHPLSGHLGVTKTYNKILNHFFWPGLKADVVEFCRTCQTCQIAGKPNQTVPIAPLHPIPVLGEPFERVIVDCVGPLPKTKNGNQFLLTAMCTSTRFPEAVPLRRITAPLVIKVLTKFFTTFGLPKVVQTDQGTNFLSKLFKQVMQTLGIKHVVSSAYHPESQGALERWHQTLKATLQKYCLDTGKEWDEGVPLMVFAMREAKQESLGFSPNELVFGHSVRGPLKLLKEQFLSTDHVVKTNVLDYVSQFRERLHKARLAAAEALSSAQGKMKSWYDKKAVPRSFNPGDKVLVLLPTASSALSARFCGPYQVDKKVNDTDYVIKTPDRKRKTRLCHLNMLKSFHSRADSLCGPADKSVASLPEQISSPETLLLNSSSGLRSSLDEDGLKLCDASYQSARMLNSEVLSQLSTYLSHLTREQQLDIERLVNIHLKLFGDMPSRTTVIEHDIDVGNAVPIKQHAYRVNMAKREMINKEVDYLLKHGLAIPSYSPWSSPCLVTPKSDGTPRFCTDFRKVNAVTVPDSFPLPRIEDCIDSVGSAAYVSKLDLLKGYWQVPLTERASEISAFVTPDHFLQYTVMAFGMRNAPATFQRLMSTVLSGVANCNVYLDDVVIYSSNWSGHVDTLATVFKRLADASLTLNLAKCEFGKATVTYLGKEVGQGKVRPISAKVNAILNFPVPTTRRELRRFLGMVGYYRCFCRNFSEVVTPLTNLCSPKVPFIWSPECHHAFECAKGLLSSSPVLVAPDFSKPFKLEVDASEVGAGAVLLQDDGQGVSHPVCFFGKKFDAHQRRYSTIEKETLAMLLALQHFDVYVGSTSQPVEVFTDHNPLVFLSRMYNNNQRLMRWALISQNYNIEIKHKRGCENIVADALSRM